MTAFDELEALLEGDDPWQGALDWVIGRTGTTSGTVHLIGPDGLLHLAAERGIPPPVRAVVERIPIGKGMAGLAAERRRPVSLCNLQTDESGDARPGARATGLRGTVAVPMLAGADRVLGTLGVGHVEEHEFAETETELLLEAGRRMARRHDRDR